MGLFKMPSLGADMEAGTLVEWMIAPGDVVKKGDTVAVVETQKGAIEIETFEAGTVGKLLVGVGETVPVGTPLAEIGDMSAAEAAPGPMPEPEPAPEPEPEPEPELPPAPVAAPVATPTPISAGRERASPAARKLAAERGIDLATIKGTGPEGAVTSRDLEGAPKAAAQKATRTSGIDFTEMRKAIGRAMARSKREIPHYYLRHQIDLRAASAWLDNYNGSREPSDRLLMGALLVKAVAMALKEFPDMNGFYENDTFTPSAAIHCGVAVAVRGGGLIAPAIHDTASLPLSDLMASMRDLVARVRAGGLKGSELSDPTITITSLGDRGVDEVYGVIHPPQVAIVGFGTVEERALAKDGALMAAPTAIVTLAADHRVGDGRRGALFLREIETLLQKPEAL